MHIRHRDSVNTNIACVLDEICISDHITNGDITRIRRRFREGQTWRRVFDGNGFVVRDRRIGSACWSRICRRGVSNIGARINIGLGDRISRSESLRIARREINAHWRSGRERTRARVCVRNRDIRHRDITDVLDLITIGN